jgi:hypothetical protein
LTAGEHPVDWYAGIGQTSAADRRPAPLPPSTDVEHLLEILELTAVCRSLPWRQNSTTATVVVRTPATVPTHTNEQP